MNARRCYVGNRVMKGEFIVEVELQWGVDVNSSEITFLLANLQVNIL